MTITRRVFLARGGAAALALLGGTAGAQQQPPTQTNMGPMDRGAYRPTRRTPRPGAVPMMSIAERDALEHRLRCQCSCTLDVYTCRTTDFTCTVSPAMHRDVLSLVDGGYGAEEIIAAFESTYGERVLMAPKREGFNLVGYLAPFAALGTGGVLVALLIRHWGTAARTRRDGPAEPSQVQASAEELERLERAIRGESR